MGRSPGSYGLGLARHPWRYSEDRARVGSVAVEIRFLNLYYR